MAAFHMKTTASVFALRALSVSAAIGVASMPGIADAGHGSVADHGSHGLIHLYVDIPDNWDSHYGAGADYQFGRLQDHFEAASRILWDATEGHLGIGTVTFYKGFGSADINVRVGESGKAPCLRAETGVLGGIGGLGVIAFCPQNLKPGPQVPDGIVIAHELGHYVLGLGDEYKDNARSGGGVCPEQGYYGSCLDGKTDDRSNCIMESDTTATEFCSRANHDPDQYNKEMCVPSGNPKVPYISTTTHQSAVNFIEIEDKREHGLSCWETMSRDFPFIPPLETISSDGLPRASPPGGYVPVSFVDLRQYPDSIVLVLDRSGSMNAHPDDDRGEVCNNGKDDDNDGVTDEADCSEPRIAYLRAAARAFLRLIAEDETLRTMYDPNHPGLRVALTSFARTASTDFELDILSGNLEKIQDVISALSPSGQTAIGDAIEQAHKQLENEVGDRAMVLISDGQQNSGADPLVTAARLGQEGIAIHTISLGAASDTPTLAEIRN